MRRRQFVLASPSGVIDARISSASGIASGKVVPGVSGIDGSNVFTLQAPDPVIGEDTFLYFTAAGSVATEHSVLLGGSPCESFKVGSYLVSRVSFTAAGTFNGLIQDGYHADDIFTVIPVADDAAAGSFAISSVNTNTLVAGVDSWALILGSGLSRVHSVFSVGSSSNLSFYRYRDSALLVRLSGLSSGSNIVRFKDSAGVELGNHTFTCSHSQEYPYPLYYYARDGVVTLFAENLVSASDVFFMYDTASYVCQLAASESLSESFNSSSGEFFLAVRTKAGLVVPYVNFTIRGVSNPNFLYVSATDVNGCIRLPLGSLPDTFTIQFARSEFSYLNHVYRIR